MRQAAAFFKNLTRTQIGLIILLVSTLPSIILIVSLIHNPSDFVETGKAPYLPYGTFYTSYTDCGFTLGSNLLSLIIFGLLFSDACHYGKSYREVFVIAVALLIGTFAITQIGGSSSEENVEFSMLVTGDIEEYRRVMHQISFGAGLYALIPSVVAWHYYRPGWRWLPVITGVYRAIIHVEASQNIIQNTTLSPIVEQKLYVLHYNVGALDIFFTVAGLIGDLLLCGMWALLVFSPAIFMQQRVEKLAARE